MDEQEELSEAEQSKLEDDVLLVKVSHVLQDVIMPHADNKPPALQYSIHHQKLHNYHPTLLV